MEKTLVELNSFGNRKTQDLSDFVYNSASADGRIETMGEEIKASIKFTAELIDILRFKGLLDKSDIAAILYKTTGYGDAYNEITILGK